MANENKEPIVVSEEEMETGAVDVALFAKKTGQYTMKLEKPVSDCGKEYTELHFDFDALTGKDCRAIEKELRLRGETVIMRKLSTPFLELVCIRACKEDIGLDFFDRLSFGQYCFITDYCKKFF